VAFAALGAGCGDDDDGPGPIDSGGLIDSGDPDSGSVPGVLKGPSKSSTIALSDDGTLVIMSNPEADSVSIFKTSDNTLLKTVPTGKEPFAVVIGPDSKTAYVANRADATVVKLTAIDTANPVVGTPLNVGSEPTGLALSPTGAKLFVAEFAEGRVSVINTAAMTLGTSVALRMPRAVAVTNDGDADDSDETLIVTEFYGAPVAGKEMKDDGRQGVVRLYKVSDLSTDGNINFASRPSQFGPAGAAGTTTLTSPNQLAAVGLQGNRIFVTSVSASPQAPLNYSQNVFPVMYVGNLSTRMEDTTAAGTTNLARKIYDRIPNATAAGPRFVQGDLTDISFVPGTAISYITARAGEVVQRTVWGTTVDVGSTQNAQIDLVPATGAVCQNPIGIVVQNSMKAWVNCWGNKSLGVLDLQNQVLGSVVASVATPPDSMAVRLGRHFYFTGRGRWSSGGEAGNNNGARGGQGWSSCGSCHPDGYSDNITWQFGAGPRQTSSQDGTFSHPAAGAQKQRVLNWTGIFDEHHDFERNTRDVSGGLGAITTGRTAVTDCGNLAMEDQVPVPATLGGLQQPLRELAISTAGNNCVRADWDNIEEYVKTIRPPRAIRFPDPTASVTAGRQVFQDQGCNKCHGGAGWTLSDRFFTPSTATNAGLTGPAGANAAFTQGTAWNKNPPSPFNWNYNTFHIQNQPAILMDPSGPAEPGVGAGLNTPPGQVSCVLRNVGTFGVPLNATATDALELKNGAAAPFARAQGRGGYNIPSLYGLSLGSPYLHHGQAATLTELFNDTKWANHRDAGAANAPNAQQTKDLIAFLLSIDASTATIDPPTGHDACP